MLFGHHGIDTTIDEHVSEIAALASDPQTIIFFDTNILSYLYKLHEAARREFFAWSDEIVAADRLVIPAWTANEYLARVTSRDLDTYTPKGKKEPSIAKKALDVLYETASQFVDDSSLRRIAFDGDRTTFLSGFRHAIDALSQYTGVFSQQFDSGVIHQQIVEHYPRPFSIPIWQRFARAPRRKETKGLNIGSRLAFEMMVNRKIASATSSSGTRS